LVREHLVQTAIERVLACHRGVLAKKIGHRTAIEPLTMQSPLAAWIKQTVDRERLQHIEPLRALAAGLEQRLPELVERKMIPQPQGEPTAAPLPRPVQLDLVDADAHGLAIERGKSVAIVRE